MRLGEFKVLLLIVISLSALFVASPALQRVLVYPQTEFFTELWLLGPEHMAEGFPYNVSNGDSYNIYLGIANHLGHAAYYSVQVKFRNSTQSAADSFNRTFSSLASLYSLNAFVADEESWELPIAFSLDYSYDESRSLVVFDKLTFNSVALDLNGYSTSWDSGQSLFLGNMFFELWIYNSTLNSFQYHERYVDLKFNMTA